MKLILNCLINDRNINEISFIYNYIDDQSVIMFSDFLRFNKQMKIINKSNNRIEISGALYFQKMLAENKTVQVVIYGEIL